MARIDWARYKLQELALVVGRRIQYTSNFVAYFGVTPSVFSALYSKAEGKTSSKALAAGLHLLKHYPTASTADCALFGVGSFTTYERLAWNGIEYLSWLSQHVVRLARQRMAHSSDIRTRASESDRAESRVRVSRYNGTSACSMEEAPIRLLSLSIRSPSSFVRPTINTTAPSIANMQSRYRPTRSMLQLLSLSLCSHSRYLMIGHAHQYEMVVTLNSREPHIVWVAGGVPARYWLLVTHTYPRYHIVISCCCRRRLGPKRVIAHQRCPDRIKDLELARSSHLLEALAPGERMIADGFYASEPKLVTPVRKPRARELEDAEVTYNRCLAEHHERVERVFAIIKQFKAMRSTWRAQIHSQTTAFFAVCCVVEMMFDTKELELDGTDAREDKDSNYRNDDGHRDAAAYDDSRDDGYDDYGPNPDGSNGEEELADDPDYAYYTGFRDRDDTISEGRSTYRDLS